MINSNRLANTFQSLVQIDSVSRNEAQICQELQSILKSLGASTRVDNSQQDTGSNTGNLVARFSGNVQTAPLLLNAHMDTVEPGNGVKPVFQNGVFKSDGTTILGADDKSAIAILLEVLTVIQENQLPHGPLEVVLTVCEEIGLLGAKHLDMSLITATYGYALDATDTRGVITRAPGANKLEFVVHGKDAHAGAAPDKGINAILIAAKAIAALKLGRIDHETTCNIGIIQGGIATNIVPPRVSVKGEVRSHDPFKLKDITRFMTAAFEDAVKHYIPVTEDVGRPSLETHIESDFVGTHIPDDHPVVSLAMNAARNLGQPMVTKITGGGADANVFFERGIMTGVLGTGMRDMHTVRESIELSDMVTAA
ncbi:MAG: M20/M25/M40 family metallo-hydrolase, partial [Desulfatirhabdiaceae bacterium]